MGYETISNPKYYDMWPVDLFAGPPNNRSMHDMTEKAYESEKKRLDYDVDPFKRMARSVAASERIMNTGEDFDWELHKNARYYNLLNFANLDEKRVTLAEKGSDEEARLWRLWGKKEHDRLYLWWDKVWGSNSHKTSKRVLCKWYGAKGGVILILGYRPSECELYYFGCTQFAEKGECELDVHNKLGNCYNEYKCSKCGNGMRVDSSG